MAFWARIVGTSVQYIKVYQEMEGSVAETFGDNPVILSAAKGHFREFLSPNFCINASKVTSSSLSSRYEAMVFV
jgi:hypothetical protein